MISSIQYGGRITDDFDKILMDNFAEKYFHPGVLHPSYELYKDERTGVKYCIPDGTEIDTFRKAIEDLPG